MKISNSVRSLPISSDIFWNSTRLLFRQLCHGRGKAGPKHLKTKIRQIELRQSKRCGERFETEAEQNFQANQAKMNFFVKARSNMLLSIGLFLTELHYLDYLYAILAYAVSRVWSIG